MNQKSGEPKRLGARRKLLYSLQNLDTMGHRIRFHRINQDMTQRDLAQAGGWSKAFVSLLESDRTDPSVPTVLKLSEVFGVSLDWLIAGKDNQGKVKGRLAKLERLRQ